MSGYFTFYICSILLSKKYKWVRRFPASDIDHKTIDTKQQTKDNVKVHTD